MTILGQYYNKNILDEDYKFSKSGSYYAPPEGDLASIIAYTRTMPMD